jgi:hypothetical protein
VKGTHDLWAERRWNDDAVLVEDVAINSIEVFKKGEEVTEWRWQVVLYIREASLYNFCELMEVWIIASGRV